MSRPSLPPGTTGAVDSSLDEIKALLRDADARGDVYTYVTLNGREAVIPTRKYSLSYIDRMTMSDVRRIAVF